ncbi:MAG: hypothetical protein A3C35_00565 [Omnitrophica bacterium RIFCSPHIGHO2_02_FULL_46_11]|nr:MAG: hypothetical protein A3C35_00565 [Omnitrophica bacterium RIFCSPHIGHO2_02_FULL_46_11]
MLAVWNSAMKFRYTDHILRRIKQRELSRQEIEETVSCSHRTEKSFGERYLARREFRGKILEVVYKEEFGSAILITAYWIKESK